MEDDNLVTPQTETEAADGSAAENAAPSTDDKYLSQKIRAEKAEKALKELKAKLAEASTEKPAAAAPVPTQPISREETILYAKGLTEAEVEYAKKVASVEGSSPLAAAESDMFKTWKKIQDDKRKADDAQLGAASGSSVRKSEKSFRDKMTPEEHRALYEKRLGR